MDVYIVWETWLKPEGAEEGFSITKQIWIDMRKFDGYEGHFLLRDQDDPGHLLLISLWKTREYADKSKEQYANNPKVKALQSLLIKERGRTVYDFQEINGMVISDRNKTS
jgi:quinol monooxygenase YgiN